METKIEVQSPEEMFGYLQNLKAQGREPSNTGFFQSKVNGQESPISFVSNTFYENLTANQARGRFLFPAIVTYYIKETDVRTEQQEVFSQGAQQIIINQTPQNQSNGLGVAGFVLALLATFLGWIPVFGWILWILGLILSIAGFRKEPKGLAIAGFIISLIGLILLLTVFASLAALLGLGGLLH
ncbi:MAG: hypothetical protein LBU90_06770 [Bacteroidales bacterium]|jgi:hypothetical protein|nr:hypothetical protein [Bacteroidales bacterium]